MFTRVDGRGRSGSTRGVFPFPASFCSSTADLGQRKRIFHRRNGKTTGARRGATIDQNRMTPREKVHSMEMERSRKMFLFSSLYLSLFLSRCFQPLCSIIPFRAVPSVVRVKWFPAELVPVSLSSRWLRSNHRNSRNRIFDPRNRRLSGIRR